MCLNHNIQLSQFDCYIGGVVNYASEIWGTQKEQNVEKLYLDFCKQLLDVKELPAVQRVKQNWRGGGLSTIYI